MFMTRAHIHLSVTSRDLVYFLAFSPDSVIWLLFLLEMRYAYPFSLWSATPARTNAIPTERGKSRPDLDFVKKSHGMLSHWMPGVVHQSPAKRGGDACGMNITLAVALLIILPEIIDPDQGRGIVRGRGGGRGLTPTADGSYPSAYTCNAAPICIAGVRYRTLCKREANHL